MLNRHKLCKCLLIAFAVVLWCKCVSAAGPLRPHPANSRYFTDDSGLAIYLTGSHTWDNLQDSGIKDPPPVFNYSAFLEFIAGHNHNFFRLWAWEQAKWTNEIKVDYWFNPMPFQRSGQGVASDGKSKFDLTRFNQAYFDRIRQRIVDAGKKDIYVSVMLFNGWSVETIGAYNLNNPWNGHPFNKSNNINDIDGDSNGDKGGREVHTLQMPAITDIQRAYVRKIIDTVNDLDNVLYEICNECHAGSKDWQYEFIRYIKAYEGKKTKRHPIGMTKYYNEGYNRDYYSSEADWISPNESIDPPISTGNKVILYDTDHICGVCGDRAWVWKSFTRGYQPVFMDIYKGDAIGCGAKGGNPDDPAIEEVRRNLGYARKYALRMDIVRADPQNALSSSGYCLAKIGSQYLTYLPSGGNATVDLGNTRGWLEVEWLNPKTGLVIKGAGIKGGNSRQSFTVPFSGDAVLFVYSRMLYTPELQHRRNHVMGKK